jgi:hypothetical protein
MNSKCCRYTKTNFVLRRYGIHPSGLLTVNCKVHFLIIKNLSEGIYGLRRHQRDKKGSQGVVYTALRGVRTDG